MHTSPHNTRQVFIEDSSVRVFPNERLVLARSSVNTSAGISGRVRAKGCKGNGSSRVLHFHSLHPAPRTETEQTDLSSPKKLAPSLHAPQSREQRPLLHHRTVSLSA